MTDENANDDRLNAAVDEAVALRETIERLVRVITASVPTQTKRFNVLAIMALIGGPLLFVATMTFAVVSVRQTRDNERVTKTGIACLLADLDDHRHTNQYAHEEIAKNINTPTEISQPDVVPLSRDQVVKLKKYCAPYVRATLGNGEGFGLPNIAGGP